MLSTPLCDLLGIDHPVLNAPMSGTATADISAGVGAGLIPSLAPAGTIVQRLVAEAEQVLRERCAVLLR